MDVCTKVEDSAISPEQCTLGPEGEGKSGFSEKKKDDTYLAEGLLGTPGNKDKTKTSTLSSLTKFVRGRSKVRREDGEKRDQSPFDNEEYRPQKDSRISKMFQNVSSSMSLRRVWGSSSSTKVAGEEGEKTETGGKLGKMLFRRKSLSKTDLETEQPQTGQDRSRLRSLGSMLSRKSNTDLSACPHPVTPEFKSLTLGRRLSSTFRGAFGKSDHKPEPQLHEAP